jgi:hypothetical protein
MNGHGFIYFWRMANDTGFIHVCSANPPSGSDAVFFTGKDVSDKNLRDELRQRNVQAKAECKSTAQNIRVRFRFDIDGDIVAKDVQRA